MVEIWKDIKGYEGFYKISNLGNIKSLPRNGTIKYEKILKPNNVAGYYQVSLQKNGIVEHKKIHRLVAEAFIQNPKEKKEVNHIDGNKHNNSVDNLEWVTTSENQIHSKYVLGKGLRKVLQYSKDNNFIKEWRSIIEASKNLNIKSSNICDCCLKNRKTAGGYVWKYAKEEC